MAVEKAPLTESTDLETAPQLNPASKTVDILSTTNGHKMPELSKSLSRYACAEIHAKR